MFKLLALALSVSALFLAISGCDQPEDVTNRKPLDDAFVYMDLPQSADGRTAAASNYGVLSAEYLTAKESGQAGKTIIFRNVGNKQLAADFVPIQSLDGTANISFYINENRPPEQLGAGFSTGAIKRAMNTWDRVPCSDFGLYQIPFHKKLSPGYVSALFGFGGSFKYVADVVHAGWLPGEFFDLLAPGGSGFILGVTFTIIFTNNGSPTDINKDRKVDVAWREIYYNKAFSWGDGANFDVETVALHEAGHGLSQGHFGKAFLDAGKRHIHFSPRAVMNAAYSGVQKNIGKTDNAGHCSLWSSWAQ
jgi:hypothetical protein